MPGTTKSRGSDGRGCPIRDARGVLRGIRCSATRTHRSNSPAIQLCSLPELVLDLVSDPREHKRLPAGKLREQLVGRGKGGHLVLLAD